MIAKSLGSLQYYTLKKNPSFRTLCMGRYNQPVQNGLLYCCKQGVALISVGFFTPPLHMFTFCHAASRSKEQNDCHDVVQPMETQKKNH
jgi:hypothetical protein